MGWGGGGGGDDLITKSFILFLANTLYCVRSTETQKAIIATPSRTSKGLHAIHNLWR